MKQKLLLLLAICLSLSSVIGQTTVTTTHTNNNGNGSVIFNVQNTNGFDVIVTDVQCHLNSSATNNLQLLYRTVPFNDVAAPWDGGMVGSGQNGWLLA